MTGRAEIRLAGRNGPTFAGKLRPDLVPTGEAGFYLDADGNTFMADAVVNGNGRP